MDRTGLPGRPASRVGLLAAVLIAGLAAFPWTEAAGIAPAHAQVTGPVGTVEIVLDVSGSMRSRVGRSDRMTLAREFALALREALEEGDEPPPSLALRAYGSESHRLRRDCTDTRLVAEMGADPDSFARALSELRPLGVSPLAHALERAAEDTASTYVLVTDGADNCGRDACRTWREAIGRAGDNRGLRLHVVAIEPEPVDLDRLRCVSRAGSGAFLRIDSPDEVESIARRLALVLQNRGRVDVRLSVGRSEAFSAPVRLLRPLTGEVVAAFPGRRPRPVPAGLYTVVVETAPPIRLEQVMVLPGETVTVDRTAFGRLIVERPEGEGRSPVSVRSADARLEVRYVRTGDLTILGSGAYDVEVDLGDSVVVREGIEVEEGRTTRLVIGGTEPGTLRVEAPGFETPPDTRVLAYRADGVDTLAVGRPEAVPAGRYRLVVQTFPPYVTENVVVDHDRETRVALPRTGALRVDLTGPEGPVRDVSVEVAEPMTGEAYGAFTTGEAVLTMPGIFRLRIRTAPPIVVDEVEVTAGETRVVERGGVSRVVLNPAAPEDAPPLRLEILSTPEGRRLAQSTGTRPSIVAQPGEYVARLWREETLLWEGPVAVAPDKSAPIDWAGPQ